MIGDSDDSPGDSDQYEGTDGTGHRVQMLQ